MWCIFPRPRDSVKALKKRIVGNKNFREIMLALTVSTRVTVCKISLPVDRCISEFCLSCYHSNIFQRVLTVETESHLFFYCGSPRRFSGSGDLCEELRPSVPRPGGIPGLCRWSSGARNSAQKQPPHCPPREGAQPYSGTACDASAVATRQLHFHK